MAVGDVLVDVVCDRLPQPGERAHGRVELRAGGSAVNAGLAAVREGADAVVVGRVGADAGGELVATTLAAHGVRAQLARDEQVATGVAVALADAVVADRGANARFSAADVPEPLPGDTLLVSGFALFQDGSRDGARAALERFTGRWAGIDLSSSRLAAGADLAVRANVVFATADEAKAATGLPPEKAAHELARSFELACVKLGAKGALAVRTGELESAVAAPVVRSAPFGAGDAFAAAFLVALGEGAELRDALERAVAAGARAAARDRSV